MTEKLYRSAMREAILEAGKGRFGTCPNPTVGAVLLRDGQIVARGHHIKAGGPHAEINCLLDAKAKGIDPRGLTMCVSLEPCDHTGRTGPCSRVLIDAGIAKVVIGCPDPNPKAAGGAVRLREAGVEVVSGVLEPECRVLVADFLTWVTQKRPCVLLKLASTLDGRIATRTGDSRWITGAESRADVHLLRAGVGRARGVVLIGGETFRNDNPLLNARNTGTAWPQPKACVMTSRLPEADENFALLRERPSETIFLTTPDAAASPRADALRSIGVTVIGDTTDPEAPSADRLRRQLEALFDRGIPYVFCEGGGRLGLSLLEAGLVDLFYLHMAPMLTGDNMARPLFDGARPERIADVPRLIPAGTTRRGEDLALALVPGSAWYAKDLGGMTLGHGQSAFWTSFDRDGEE